MSATRGLFSWRARPLMSPARRRMDLIARHLEGSAAREVGREKKVLHDLFSPDLTVDCQEGIEWEAPFYTPRWKAEHASMGFTLRAIGRIGFRHVACRDCGKPMLGTSLWMEGRQSKGVPLKVQQEVAATESGRSRLAAMDGVPQHGWQTLA